MAGDGRTVGGKRVRTMRKMRMARLLLLALPALLPACETSIDPSTGQSQTRLTLPLTQANADASERRWWECVQFRSESWCERNLPNGRPPGISTLNPPAPQGGLTGGRQDP
jgi:hypothetical protein